MLTFKQWLVEASTISQLDSNAARVGKTDRQQNSNDVTVLSDMKYAYNADTETLTIDARTRSKSGSVYIQRIIIPDCPQTEEGVEIPHPAAEVIIEPISLSQKNIKVACDCMDFRFRFAPHNDKDSSLASAPPPAYTRVPGSTRPPVNPQKLPGMCKHLYKVINALENEGLVVS